jgi:hypothetical protein
MLTTVPILEFVGETHDHNYVREADGLSGALETKQEDSPIQQLLWRLALVCTQASNGDNLNTLVNETYTLVGFGPMTSALENL